MDYRSHLAVAGEEEGTGTMAEQAERNTGWKILGGLLAFVLLIAWCSDPDPDEDAWSQGADADDADFDVDDSETDADFAWTEGDEDGPGPPPCDGVGWFAAEGGAVLLPVAGSGTELPTPSCQLGGTPDGDADAVELLQGVLAACNGQPVTVDGAYGPQTAQAVSAVQGANDIAVDGVYGPQTNAVMAWPVGTATGDVVGDDPIADRPACTADPVEPAPTPLPGTG